MDDFETTTLGERVYRKVRQLILSGDVPMGATIDERVLADRLNVSRTPVRVAIAQLAQEGVVQTRPYRASSVRSYSCTEVSELFEYRKALEGHATRLAVQNLGDSDLECLLGLLKRVAIAIEQGDLVAFGAADREFHQTIARLSRNQPLIVALQRLDLQVQLVRNMVNRDPTAVQRTLVERPRIVEALKSRNAELAERLMEEHIEGVREAFVREIEGPAVNYATSSNQNDNRVRKSADKSSNGGK